jgi:hypothetical protein
MSTDTRHFQMLQRFVTLEYKCKSHGLVYNNFHVSKKSLFCTYCLEEMDFIDDRQIFQFKNKAELFSKLLSAFNYLECKYHHVEYKYYCLYHMLYYCKTCLEINQCDNIVHLIPELVTRKRSNLNSLNTNNNIRNNFNQLRNNDSYISDNSHDRTRDLIKLWDNRVLQSKSSGNNFYEKDNVKLSTIKSKKNLKSESENNSYSYSNSDYYSDQYEHEEDEESDSSVESILESFENCRKKLNDISEKTKNEKFSIKNEKINIKNEKINIKNEKNEIIQIPQQCLNFKYPFLNNQKLIIYDSVKNNYVKTKISKENLNRNNTYIIPYLYEDNYTEKIYLYLENSITAFFVQKPEIKSLIKFNEIEADNIFHILGILSDKKVVYLDKNLEFNFLDLDSNEIENPLLENMQKFDCKKSDYFMSSLKEKPSIEIREKNIQNLLQGNYLFIHLFSFTEDSINLVIYNDNFSEFSSYYENKKLIFQQFKQHDEDNNTNSNFLTYPIINKNLANKINLFSSNSFFYIDEKSELSYPDLNLCFILKDEIFIFKINLKTKTFILNKHVHLGMGNTEFLINKKSSSSNNTNINSENSQYNNCINLFSSQNESKSIYYLNEENVLIKFDIETGLFSQHFEFI